MAQTKSLFDQYGVVHNAFHDLPDDSMRVEFLAALAELEDNECHRTRSFPRTRLHRVTGVKEAIYRADVTKVSGWRIHVQYIDGGLHLKDLLPGANHDDVIRVIKSKRGRYE
ncbi:MAG: hypothetical protein M5U13_11870 [Thermoanaerobaculia bacterium]|nr:hypothetical protein [Thermoanaerobaculia bacterium]